MTGDQQTIHKENPVGKIMQRSIGAYYRYVHGRLHLFFFFTVIKPEPRHWGPKVNHYRKKPQSICLLHAAHSSDSDISRTLRFYDDRGHQTYLPVFYFQTALRHSDYVPPSWIWLAGSLYAWTSSLTRFRYKNLGDREREIKQANVSQRKNSQNKMVRSKNSAI